MFVGSSSMIRHCKEIFEMDFGFKEYWRGKMGGISGGLGLKVESFLQHIARFNYLFCPGERLRKISVCSYELLQP